MEDEGYDSYLDLKDEYDWENKTIGKIKERLGLEEGTIDYDEEGSGKNNDDGDGKIGEDGNNYNNDYGREKGDDNKKRGGRVVGGIIDKSKEENDDNKGPQKRCSHRKKSRVEITELGRQSNRRKIITSVITAAIYHIYTEINPQ